MSSCGTATIISVGRVDDVFASVLQCDRRKVRNADIQLFTFPCIEQELSSMKRDSPFFPPFHFDGWAAVDDRVRGGSSQSHLEPVEIDETGRVQTSVAVESRFHEEKQLGRRQIGARFWGTLGKSCQRLVILG